MTLLNIDQLPELKDPIVIVAFEGWNDAANAATDAARFVVRRMGARKFASIDSERFYDFRETRPNVQLTLTGDREVQWPQNDFYYARNPKGGHDIVVSVGVEPSLAWRTFAETHLALYRELGVKLVVALGALLADVPHTRPTRVTGTALDPEVASRLNLAASRYEGPTGIVGVLHEFLRRANVPAASLWANVPHYITTNSNPMATSALLQRLQEVLGLTFDLTELEGASRRFVQEVDTALGTNPEVAEYVQRLEEAADNPDEEPPDREGELPPSADVILDVEEFLRNQRDEE